MLAVSRLHSCSQNCLKNSIAGLSFVVTPEKDPVFETVHVGIVPRIGTRCIRPFCSSLICATWERCCPLSRETDLVIRPMGVQQ